MKLRDLGCAWIHHKVKGGRYKISHVSKCEWPEIGINYIEVIFAIKDFYPFVAIVSTSNHIPNSDIRRV